MVGGFTLRGAALGYKVLDILLEGTVVLSSGKAKPTSQHFYFIWDGNSTAPQESSKAYITAGSASTTFKSAVYTPVVACLNARWSATGLFSRWLDVYSDPFALQAAVSDSGGVTGNSAPNEVQISFRKIGTQRGKSNHGRFSFHPISQSDIVSTGDELSASGITNWSRLKVPLCTNISDGISVLQPCIISAKNSQLKGDKPLRISGQVMISSSTIVVGSSPGLWLDKSVGENRRLRERPSTGV